MHGTSACRCLGGGHSTCVTLVTTVCAVTVRVVLVGGVDGSSTTRSGAGWCCTSEAVVADEVVVMLVVALMLVGHDGGWGAQVRVGATRLRVAVARAQCLSALVVPFDLSIKCRLLWAPRLYLPPPPLAQLVLERASSFFEDARSSADRAQRETAAAAFDSECCCPPARLLHASTCCLLMPSLPSLSAFLTSFACAWHLPTPAFGSSACLHLASTHLCLWPGCLHLAPTYLPLPLAGLCLLAPAAYPPLCICLPLFLCLPPGHPPTHQQAPPPT